MDKKFDGNIERVIKEFTNENGDIDFKKASAKINDDFNKYSSSKMPDMDKFKDEARTLAVNEFIKELKMDNVSTVDEFIAYKKRMGATSTELTEANTRLTAELTEKTNAYETMETDFKNLKNESGNNAFKLDIYEEKYDPKYMNSVKAEFDARIKGLEEFDKKEIHKSIQEDFPEFKLGHNAGVENFGNRKPNGNMNPGFGGNKDSKSGFYGGKVK